MVTDKCQQEPGPLSDTTPECSTTNNYFKIRTTSFSDWTLWAEATYNFNGFFQPVDNLPVLNVVKAGSAIPVTFSLNGNQGLNIFATGYPAYGVTVCNSTDTIDTIEVTVTAGGSSLTYNAATDQYTYVWKTDKGWAGKCRQLNVKLNDGTIHIANFRLAR